MRLPNGVLFIQSFWRLLERSIQYKARRFLGEVSGALSLPDGLRQRGKLRIGSQVVERGIDLDERNPIETFIARFFQPGKRLSPVSKGLGLIAARVVKV